jgi:hypothetical protein
MSFHSHDMETKSALTDQQMESAVKEFSSDERALAFTPQEQKAIVRRVDLRLVVTLGCLYCISLLDRTNLGAASVAGYVHPRASISLQADHLYRMQKEMNMNAKNNAYTIVSLVFFITYTIFQAPAVVVIRKIGPRRFLASIVLMWGAVMLVSSS